MARERNLGRTETSLCGNRLDCACPVTCEGSEMQLPAVTSISRGVPLDFSEPNEFVDSTLRVLGLD